jgi:hypothetical protein
MFLQLKKVLALKDNGRVIMNSEETVSKYRGYEPHFNTLP